MHVGTSICAPSIKCMHFSTRVCVHCLDIGNGIHHVYSGLVYAWGPARWSWMQESSLSSRQSPQWPLETTVLISQGKEMQLGRQGSGVQRSGGYRGQLYAV